MDLREAIPHFSEIQSEQLLDFVNNDVLLDSRYLFYQTAPITKSVMAYCTHCNQEYKTEQHLKHNKPSQCLQCGSICIVKQSFRGRGKMLDSAYVEYAEPSLVDPEAFTVSGYYVYRDYRDDYKCVETGFVRLAMYVFKPGESHMWKRSKWDICEGYNNFVKTKSITSLGRSNMQNVNSYLSRKSFAAAVENTSYRYSQWELYYNDRLLEYFALVCKYPIVEVLTKIGLRDVIWHYLNKSNYGSLPCTFKWRAKTLDKIIGLPKVDWKQIKKLPRPISGVELHAMQELRKTGEIIPFLELFKINEELGGVSTIVTLKQLTGSSLRKIYRYVCKQYQLDEEHYGSPRQVCVTWRDYLLECKRTHVNLQDPSNIFPKNVRRLHDLQNERKKAIADLKLNLKIRKRAKELADLEFACGSFFIRPIESAQELADESNQLSHCVSTYDKKYANGETNLLVIRKINEPDKPFYTVEISKRMQVVQVRGLKNAPSTDEVKLFTKAFERAKLEKEMPIAV